MISFVRRVLSSAFARLQKNYYDHRYDSYGRTYDINPNFGFNGTDIRFL
jgi:hypothetical protein